MKHIINTILLSAIFTLSSFAQVTIAPTNLFIDDNSRFGTYLVLNNSQQNQEISIDFFFGYSTTDDKGNRTTVKNDSSLVQKYSIAQHVRAFPQSFILSPGNRQVVRLRIAAPNSLDDGTYWARIKTMSTPESQAVEISGDEAVSAQVGIVVEQITGLFYKKGNVSTDIQINDIRTSINEDQLTILTDFNRLGNSPFLGSIFVSILDTDGNLLSEAFASTSYYFDGTHKQILDISELNEGSYTIKVKFESRRTDISTDNIIQMEPVSATTTVTIP